MTGRITTSPFLIFIDRRAKCKADVPLEQATACLEPT
tara:strand:+ start:584 stop:694 length:111 start_codon:yes stop_codon:yes gene_type:complete